MMPTALRTVSNNHQVATGNTRKNKENFAASVHNLVTEGTNKNPSIVSWTQDGNAFIVDPLHPDLPHILAKYFQHSRYSSFQRQLNTYGWRKPRSGKYVGTFYNPLFHRDNSTDEISRGGLKRLFGGEQNGDSNDRKLTQPKHRGAGQSTKNKCSEESQSPNTDLSKLPLKKRSTELGFLVSNMAPKPLSKKIIEHPTEADMTAVEVLLRMTRNPLPLLNDGVSVTSYGRGDCQRTDNFAESVHRLVTEVDARDSSMITWVDDGNAFKIDRTHPDLGKTLAKYFQHSNYSSFQRQLNQYGWRKHRSSGKFFNHLFHRDKRRANLDRIIRKDKMFESRKRSRSGSKKRSSAKDSIRSTLPRKPNRESHHAPSLQRMRRHLPASNIPQLVSTDDDTNSSSSDDDSFVLSKLHGHKQNISGTKQSVVSYFTNNF